MDEYMKKVTELQERFDVHNGQFFAYNLYKNLNWYLGNQWFCFGDIRDEDIDRLQGLLEEGEVLQLGWKELPQDMKMHDFFQDGGGLWLEITKDQVNFVKRRLSYRTYTTG